MNKEYHLLYFASDNGKKSLSVLERFSRKLFPDLAINKMLDLALKSNNLDSDRLKRLSTKYGSFDAYQTYLQDHHVGINSAERRLMKTKNRVLHPDDIWFMVNLITNISPSASLKDEYERVLGLGRTKRPQGRPSKVSYELRTLIACNFVHAKREHGYEHAVSHCVSEFGVTEKRVKMMISGILKSLSEEDIISCCYVFPPKSMEDLRGVII